MSAILPESKPAHCPASADALFGREMTRGIVSVEPDGEQGVWLYRREGAGVMRERRPYKPWILLTERPANSLPAVEWTDLEGDGYHLLAEFPTHACYHEARFRVRDAHLANLTYPGGAKMALIRSGMTLFKGMTFDDIVRLQFDIETEGLNAENPATRILLIAVSDNRGLVRIIEGDESEILRQFVALVQDRDPDVIEGHNIFGFDLPFLMERARRHGVVLALGRDGSEPRRGQERNYAIGGNSRPFVPAYIHGRHLFDTYLVVQRFDWARQALTSYGLKECARVYGFAEDSRVELPRGELAHYYREDPELVRTYARQDVVETRKLADLIAPVEFYQAQMVPDNYGQVVVTGNGEKINAIFIRAYLAEGHAVPCPQSSSAYEGGYTEIREKGVLRRVVKADVESLYPSLMLTNRIAPATDTLGVFLPSLKELTHRRLEAKRRAVECSVDLSMDSAVAASDGNYNYWDGLQSSYKVLINSFYGYLGGPFSFNDYSAARKVTELGRILVQEVAANLEATGSKVIEIDTDGVFFVPPAEIAGESAEQEYIKVIGSVLPEGIRLAFDGRFASMLSLKTKNYVLVGYDGRKILKGASLRSRADERYGRRFLVSAIDCLLEHDYQGVADLYARNIDDLLNRRVAIDDLVRRERVTEKTFQSEQKRRAALVADGIAIGEHVQVYEKADGTLGLREQYAGDENPRYYMDKLYKFARRLEDAFESPAAFGSYIPRPTSQGLPHALQATLDLF